MRYVIVILCAFAACPVVTGCKKEEKADDKPVVAPPPVGTPPPVSATKPVKR